MKIKYIAERCENAFGGEKQLESHEFTEVTKAIEFCDSKTTGSMSWWQIKVEWDK